MASEIKFAFAGDRDIAVWVLEHLLQTGHRPRALLLSSPKKATHAETLRALCPFVPDSLVWRGKEFRAEPARAALAELDLDYIVGIHFPYIVPPEVLEIPRHGVLNLHPAYLPFNRGWHTPSWAILDGTPVGATLHFMDQAIDNGDIIHRETLEVEPGETADSLYHRLKELELQVFKAAWPGIVAGSFTRTAQDAGEGTTHTSKELHDESVQRIDLDGCYSGEELIRRLRALTTSRISEAAYFEVEGKRYRIRVEIDEERGKRGQG